MIEKKHRYFSTVWNTKSFGDETI